MAEYLIQIVLAAVLLICLYTDLKERKVYNKVVGSALLLGLVLVAYFYGAAGLLSSGKGFLLGTLLLLLPFAVGGIGAGDVKLLATIGFFQGSHFTFNVFLLAALLGGGFALVLLWRRGRLWSVLKDMLRGIYLLLLSGFKVNTFPSLQQQQGGVILPYAPALVAASFMVYFLGYII